MDVQQLHYAPLLNQLHQRAVRSVVSQLALRSKSLTHYLESQYFQPPGQEGSLLADPVFESTFGWMPADETMEDLRDKLISSPLVDALSKAPVPFRHQLTAWRTILEDKKSLLVSSGTGSGKTECFMVPVLEDLIRQQKSTRQSLTGTQAIFLYPLNALINSQQERLREWTRGFKGKIRFALYNGETRHTKYEIQEDQLKVPEQALSREAIYEAPPSIMVTNTTMLEVKSNAIVYAKNNMTIGIGAGQMSRVYSAKIAGIKAADEGLEVKGSSMASDAFFPFRDGIDAAAAAGVTCVIQPGGSIRDDEVIAAADEHGIAMLFTDMRHFRH